MITELLKTSISGPISYRIFSLSLIFLIVIWIVCGSIITQKKENDDVWGDFIKYQKIAEDSKHEHSNANRATAIFALGEYYERKGTQFPHQVHIFFKKVLDDFWDDQEIYHKYMEQIENQENQFRMSVSSKIPNDKLYQISVNFKNFKNQLPEYIKAVHKVIKEKSTEITFGNKNLFHYKNGLLLDYFNLSCANLHGVNFSNAKGCETNFSGANLDNSLFVKADLFLPNFVNTNLNNAKLISAKIKGGVFWYANIFGSDLSKIDSFGMKLANANIKNTVWVQAKLIGAMINTPLIGVNFSRAKLNGAYLNGASFGGANLTKADLTNADFTGSKNLIKAKTNDAIFNSKTKFPDEFNPEKAGMKLVKKQKGNNKK